MPQPAQIDIDDIDFDLPSDEEPTAPTGEAPKPDDPPANPDPSKEEGDPDPPKEKEEEGDPDPEEVEETEEGTKEGDEGEGEEDSGVISGLKTRLGFDFGEEEFEDTPEGVIELMNRAADKKAELLIDKFVEENPQAADFWKYLRAGGNPEQYIKVKSPEINYLDIQEVSDDDAPTQERLVRDNLRASGETDEAINEAIEEYKAAGILAGEAKRALSRLQRDQKGQQENLVKQQEAQAAELKRQRDEYFEGLNQEIKKAKDFKGLPITEKDKDDFFAFIKPSESGVSEYAKKIGDLGNEELLALQYLVYRNFDLSKLIKIKSSTDKAKTFSEMLKKGGKDTPSGTRRERNSSTVSVEDLDLSLPAGV